MIRSIRHWPRRGSSHRTLQDHGALTLALVSRLPKIRRNFLRQRLSTTLSMRRRPVDCIQLSVNQVLDEEHGLMLDSESPNTTEGLLLKVFRPILAQEFASPS
jgi:hypothetical protein